jgi:hypothetical protein
VDVGAVPLPREMGLATADTRMKMATTRRKAALATKTTRAREEITADEGLRERLDMRASFLPYTNRHSDVWPWYTISDTIIQTRQSMHATGYAGRVTRTLTLTRFYRVLKESEGSERESRDANGALPPPTPFDGLCQDTRCPLAPAFPGASDTTMVSEIPKSLASWMPLLPLVCRRRSATCLNSGVHIRCGWRMVYLSLALRYTIRLFADSTKLTQDHGAW